MIGLLRQALKLWTSNGPLWTALVRFATLLIQAVSAHGDAGKFITATEWDKASAAAYGLYMEAARARGWTPVRTAGDILEDKEKPRC